MQLPPAQVTRAVIQRYARIVTRYADDLGDRPLVLPNGDFFPDQFTGDKNSVALLAERMQGYAGLGDIPISTRVVASDSPEPKKSGCGSGACATPQSGGGFTRLLDEGDAWILQVPAQELRHPVALTTNLARSLAFVFLVETQKEGEVFEPPVDVTADFIAVALGLGPLMLQGSYIYAKSCGGPQIASVTKVGVSELAIAVALFAELGGHDATTAKKSLDLTQRSALSEATRLVRSNKHLLQSLKQDPKSLARGDFRLTEPGAFLSNMLRKFKKQDTAALLNENFDSNMDLAEVEALMMAMPPSSRAGRRLPQKTDAARDELKGLVAEALNESRA